MRNLLRTLWKGEEGQDLVEYALLITLISLAVTAALQPLAQALDTVFNNANASLS